MRIFIVHIGNFLLDGNSGVAQKTFSQAAEFRNLAVDVEVVAFTARAKIDVNHSFKFTRIDTTHLKDPYAEVLSFFRSKLLPNDAVFFRYPFASKGLMNVTSEFGRQIIFEHNTIEHQEFLLGQIDHFKTMPFSFRPSYIGYFLRTFIFKKTKEDQYGTDILKNAAGGICVTNEIAAYEKKRCGSYRTIAIGNAAPQEGNVDFAMPKFDGALRVVMVLGALHLWHGLDRALKGLEAYRADDVVIELDLIGIDENQLPAYQRSDSFRVKTLGRMTLQQLDEVIPSYHVAVGSLALHRIGLSEASPLKVRQCMVSGLPVVLGYLDTDVSQSPELSYYVCQFPADDSKLDWSRIVRFYKGIAQEQHSREHLIASAISELSMQVKARKAVDFIVSCSGRSGLN
jgi:glycosyltransferase involved in cell wall biosynthesis